MVFYEKNSIAKDKKQGFMLLFDGTSCAGKTSICTSLLTAHQPSYHYVALDDFITDIFEEQKQSPKPINEFVTICNTRTESMYRNISSLVQKGDTVVCDTTLTCLEDTASTHRWFNIINTINNFLILVYCPFHVVIQRLQQRNHHAREHKQPQNSRIASIVLHQFDAMFKAHPIRTQFCLDELSRNNIERAFECIRDDFANAHEFEKLRLELMTNLGLFDYPKIYIAPRLTYDYIINTDRYPVERCVQLIAENLIVNS